jgi:hypothetical protein
VKLYGLHLIVSDETDRPIGERYEKLVAEIIAALEEKEFLVCTMQVKGISSRAEFDNFIPKEGASS